MRMSGLYKFLFFSFCISSFGSASTMESKETIAALVSGNTVLVSNKYGPSSVYFDPSGVFMNTDPDGALSKGTWRATETSVCVKTEPTAAGKVFPEFCMDFSNRKINDTWENLDPKNGNIRLKLVKGRAGK